MSAGTKLYLLDGGTHPADGSICTYNKNRGKPNIQQVYSAYIDHPEMKILVDTGLDLSIVPPFFQKEWDPMIQREDQRLTSALGRVGVKPEDIDVIINTHLHIDHCSYNKLFTKAAWLLQQKELLNALYPEKFEGGYVKAAVQSCLEAGLKTEILNGDYDVARGVRIISTPGHTEGHQSILVETENSGSFVLTGDICMVRENFEGSEQTSPEGWPPGAHVDLREDMRSLRRMKKIMQETRARTMKTCVPLYSHDSIEFAKWKQAPDYYS